MDAKSVLSPIFSWLERCKESRSHNNPTPSLQLINTGLPDKNMESGGLHFWFLIAFIQVYRATSPCLVVGAGFKMSTVNSWKHLCVVHMCLWKCSMDGVWADEATEAVPTKEFPVKFLSCQEEKTMALRWRHQRGRTWADTQRETSLH